MITIVLARIPWAALARNLRDAGFRPWEKCENRSYTKNLSGVFGRLPYTVINRSINHLIDDFLTIFTAWTCGKLGSPLVRRVTNL